MVLDQQESKLVVFLSYILEEKGHIPIYILDALCYTYNYTNNGIENFIKEAKKQNECN